MHSSQVFSTKAYFKGALARVKFGCRHFPCQSLLLSTTVLNDTGILANQKSFIHYPGLFFILKISCIQN